MDFIKGDDIFYGFSIGKNKDFANLPNIDLLKAKDTFSKDEILSVFQNNTDKISAQKIFDFFNTNKDQELSKAELLNLRETLVFEYGKTTQNIDDEKTYAD